MPTLSTPIPKALNSICDGRLTGTTAEPEGSTEVVLGSNLYFSPYKGNRIALYDGSSTWNVRTFSELTVTIPSTVFQGFDVFAYDNAGTVAVETANWNTATGSITGATNASPIVITSNGHGLSNGDIVGITGIGGNTAANTFIWDVRNVAANTFELRRSTGNGAYTTGGTWYKIPYSSVRATALVKQDGVYVKSGATTRRYLGSCLTSSTSARVEDQVLRRWIWNYNNRLTKGFSRLTTASHTVNTAGAYRSFNNSSQAGRTEIFLGVREDSIFLGANADGGPAAAGTRVLWGVGINTDDASNIRPPGFTPTSADYLFAGSIEVFAASSLRDGLNYFVGSENSTANATWESIKTYGSVNC